MITRIFLAVASYAMSLGAFAQTGTLIQNPAVTVRSGGKLSDSENRQLMYGFASCTVHRWRSGVDRFLGTVPGSDDAQLFAQRLSSDKCLISGQMIFKESTYRAAVYDVLYHVDFTKDAPIDFSTVAPIEYDPTGKTTDHSAAPDFALLHQLADCAVRKGPKEARQLILSSIGSPAEAEAFSAFIPSVSACMTNDVTLKFSKWTLRGFVGEALYRLSVAARDGHIPG